MKPKYPRISPLRALDRLSPIAALILHVGLPIIALLLTASAVCFREALDADRLTAALRWLPEIEALLCSLTLLIGGALLFDHLERTSR